MWSVVLLVQIATTLKRNVQDGYTVTTLWTLIRWSLNNGRWTGVYVVCILITKWQHCRISFHVCHVTHSPCVCSRKQKDVHVLDFRIWSVKSYHYQAFHDPRLSDTPDKFCLRRGRRGSYSLCMWKSSITFHYELSSRDCKSRQGDR